MPPIQLQMPALSPTMTSGTLRRWLVQEGQEIVPGQAYAEVETDKAVMEIEAADAGVLGRILVPDDSEDVPVNAAIGVLLEEGETLDDLEDDPEDDPGAGAASPPPPPTEREPAASSATSSLPPGEAPSRSASQAGDAVQAKAAPEQTSLGPTSRGPTNRGPTARRPGGQAGAGEHSRRIFVSPLARRLAQKRGYNLELLTGTGPRGRIILRDVTAFSAAPAPASPGPGLGERRPAAEGSAASLPRSVQPAARARDGGVSPEVSSQPLDPPFRDEKPSMMRRVIAQRLSHATQTVPHFHLTAPCVLDELLALRARLNAGSEGAFKLSVNDFMIRALALALRDFPEANCSWLEDKIRYYERVDISVAVAVEGGLVTPILRDAARKSVLELSTEIQQLAQQARAGTLPPHAYQGGTFSLSNLGMYGVRHFEAILNPPQGGILAVGAAEKIPTVGPEDRITVATQACLTLGLDHRVIDGATGARFLRLLRHKIETPLFLLL